MVKVICCWSTLIVLASELGKAKKSGDLKRIQKAELEHEAYRKICLKADAMLL